MATPNATLTVYRGRDNVAKFGALYRDGGVVPLAGVTRVVVSFGGASFDSATYPSQIKWDTTDEINGAQHPILTLQLGGLAPLDGVADGRYTDGRVVIYDADNLNGVEIDSTLTVAVR